MVKIKESFVMNAREQAELDRLNALPRKSSGRVAYYFKPQTKYPPRIYVFMDADLWQSRNRRPMGLQNAFPFLTRPMNREEIEYHHFNARLCCHQYEDWDKLLYAEEQEAEELNRENPGTGTAFLEKLKSYRERYHIGEQQEEHPKTKTRGTENRETEYLKELLRDGVNYTARDIIILMEKERQGEKSLGVLILLRELLKNLSKTDKTELTIALIERKVFISMERTRKNFVRRVYKKNKLFALEEIGSRYPGYDETMLLNDLKQKKGRKKDKKTKPVLDLRRSQLAKLAFRLKTTSDENEYHATCCRMVMLQNAHNHRLPIPLTVRLQDETLVYSFDWKTREQVVKSFVELANAKGMTHEQLKVKYQELITSRNSF